MHLALTHAHSALSRSVRTKFLAAKPIRLLTPPYIKHRGKELMVPGSFWPGGPTNDMEKLFKIRAIGADDKHKVRPKSRTIHHDLLPLFRPPERAAGLPTHF